MTPDNKLQTDDTEAPMKHTMTSKQKQPIRSYASHEINWT